MAKKRQAKKRVYRRKRKMNKKMYKKTINPKITHLPFGQSQKVNHKYVDHVNVSTSIGVRGFYSFALNGLYDPNITGAGHQPLGMDQVELIFNNYCVINAYLKVTVLNTDADEYLMAVLYISEEATPPTSPAELLEQGSQVSRVIPPLGSAYDNGRSTLLTTRVSMKKAFRVSSMLDREDVNAVRTANPSRLLYAHLCVWQPAGGATSVSSLCIFELYQTAIWYKPRNVGYSS